MHRFVPARAAVRSLATALVLLVLGANVSDAQFLAPALDRAGTDARLRQPSLRLKTMGGVYLAVSDENNEINLWDFAGSANGMLRDRDSTSLDVFLDKDGHHAEHTQGPYEVETDRVSSLVLGLQAVGRGSRFAGGLEGGLVSLDRGLPAQAYGYEDRSISQPVALPAINGLIGSRMSWAMRGVFGSEKFDQALRRFTLDGNEIKLEGGDVVEYPTVFTPVEGSSSTSGIGFGLGYDVVDWAVVAVNVDFVKSTLEGESNSARRVYELEEKRPSTEWSGAAILDPFDGLNLGAQVGRRTYDSEESYRFSLSGGQGVPPLASRGTRLTREYHQEYFRARATYQRDGTARFTFGGDINVRYDRDDVAPGIGDGNWNDFITSLQADSLPLPPLVLADRQELRHWDAGLGVAFRATSRLLASLEAHRFNNARDGLSVHTRQKITDVRAGVEYGLDPAWMVRLGASLRADDPDVYASDNEHVRNAFSAGVGWAKPGSSYALDAGFELASASTDFPDPTEGSGSGLRFFLYNRWDF